MFCCVNLLPPTLNSSALRTCFEIGELPKSWTRKIPGKDGALNGTKLNDGIEGLGKLEVREMIRKARGGGLVRVKDRQGHISLISLLNQSFSFFKHLPSSLLCVFACETGFPFMHNLVEMNSKVYVKARPLPSAKVSKSKNVGTKMWS